MSAQTDESASNAPAATLTFEGAYTGDLFVNAVGGRRRDVAYLHNIDLTAAVHLESLVGWKGASLFVYGLGNQGGDPSGFVGDAQGVNNIEAVNAWRLFELWLQQRALDDRVSLLAGLYDLNTEFDVIQSASVFLNSSFGIGPEFALSRETGPSIFPVTSFGARLRVAPSPAVYGQLTVLDGVPGDPADPEDTHIEFAANDGALVAAEFGVTLGGTPKRSGTVRARRRRLVSRHEAASYAAKVALGAWRYTAEFHQFADADGDGDPDVQSGNWGLYALAELRVASEAEDGSQGLWLFGRAGVADPSVNRFARYSGAGLVYQGPFRGRDDDQVGIAVAAAHNGAPFRAAERAAGRFVRRSEVAIEFTYSVALLANLSVQADVQHIVAPNTDPALGNALTFGLRLQYEY